MPQFELKEVQRDLDQKIIWPVYWLYGPEKYKSRELLKKIRMAVLGTSESSGPSLFAWNEEIIDGSDVDVETALDIIKNPTLGGGVKLVVVRDAHALKSIEKFSELLGPPNDLSQLSWVCVCLSKDLDGRKKFSKTLIEQSAVVHCEEVAENQKAIWIQFLAKQHEVELSPGALMQVSALEPWSLEIVDQELQKLSIADGDEAILLGSASGNPRGTEGFLDSFFLRDLNSALAEVGHFASHIDESLPLLGLLGWNVRQLALFLSDRENGTRHLKSNPYLAEKLQRWGRKWKLKEVIQLQDQLTQVDFSLKQTPLLALGVWSDLVVQFCR
jgi:DNA polymerase III delta subunit